MNFFQRLSSEPYLSIRWKLVLPLAVIFVIVAILAPITNQLVTSSVEAEADRRLGEIADSVGALVDNSEYQAISGAALVAAQPQIWNIFINRAADENAILAIKTDLRFQELSLYTADFIPGDTAFFYGGPQVARRLQVSASTDQLRSELILIALQSGKPISGVAIAPQGSQIIGVAPVFSPGGNTVIGAVLAAFYMDQPYIDNISKIIGTKTAIVKDNKVIATTISQSAGYEQLIDNGWLASAELPATNVKIDNRDYRMLAHPLILKNKEQGTVLVAQPIDTLFQVSRNILWILIAFGAITIVVTGWFWTAALIAFTRPLVRLTEAASNVREGQILQHVEIPLFGFKDEITELGESFNRMTADLNNLYTKLDERVQVRTQELLKERNKLQIAMHDLQEARDQAVAANKSKTEFVSIVSHELKIPMTSIKGYSDLMISGATGALNDNQANFLKTIRSNVNRMATLVSDLADISRIESGNLRLEPAPVKVQDVIEDVINLSRNAIEQKQQTLRLDIPADLLPVFYDRNRLSQIMTNLISNANKYTQDGGEIIVSAKTIMDNTKGGYVAQISVKDNGLGMTPEDQEKLFSKFFRSSDEKVREAPGTGLGLNITKNLIELQGGAIWFESEYRKGTTFHFTAPIDLQTENPAEKK
jgi:signal transduction histidine kinase